MTKRLADMTPEQRERNRAINEKRKLDPAYRKRDSERHKKVYVAEKRELTEREKKNAYQRAYQKSRYMTDPTFRKACWERIKAYRARNPEAAKARTRAWFAANKDKNREYKRRHRARVRWALSPVVCPYPLVWGLPCPS